MRYTILSQTICRACLFALLLSSQALSHVWAAAPQAAHDTITTRTAVRPSLALVAPRKRIIIDPGHGGIDPGTQSLAKSKRKVITEKEIDLAIALQVQQILRRMPNVTPLVTRDRDVHVSKEDRIAFAEKLGGNLYVSIHANATKHHSKSPSLRGVALYYAGSATALAAEQRGEKVDWNTEENIALPTAATPLPKNNADGWRSFSAKACQSLKASFAGDSYYRQFKIRVRPAPYVVLYNRVMPSILIEVGYMDVPREMVRLADPAFRKRIATLIANGILRYLAEQDPKFAYSPIKVK